METINDVLHFLSKLDFAGYLENEDYEKVTCNKKVLTDEFQDVNSEKLINKMNIVDDLCFFFITQEYCDVQIINSFLRRGIILLLKKWMTKMKNFSSFN